MNKLKCSWCGSNEISQALNNKEKFFCYKCKKNFFKNNIMNFIPQSHAYGKHNTIMR